MEDFALPLPSLLLPSSSESLSNDDQPSTEYKLLHSSFNNDNNDENGSNNSHDDNNQNYDVFGSTSVIYEHQQHDDIVNNNMDGRFPVDLSNDIAINQMLLDQGAPFNPDAEIFSIDKHDQQEQQQQQQLHQRPIQFTDIK